MDLGLLAFVCVVAFSPGTPLSLFTVSTLGAVFIVAARLRLFGAIGAAIEVVAFGPFFPRSFRASAGLRTRTIEPARLVFCVSIVTEICACAFLSVCPFAVRADLNEESLII